MTKQTGFTLIEILMIVAIMIFLGLFTTPILTKFVLQTNQQNKTNEVVFALRNAQTNSIAGKGNSRWGVNISSTTITMYKGTAYATRDTAFDQAYIVPSSITITATDIAFEKNTGKPNAPATITISSNVGTNTISINSEGVVNVN